MSHLDDTEEQLRRTNSFAATLVGLSEEEAIERAHDAGHPVVIIRPPQYATTWDLRPHRVRLQIDRSGCVDKAFGG